MRTSKSFLRLSLVLVLVAAFALPSFAQKTYPGATWRVV